MPVKDNQAVLRRKIACLFESPSLFHAEFRPAEEVTHQRGRVEVRRLCVSDSLPAGYLPFPFVAQVFRLERQVILKRTGELRSETVYGITSLPACKASAARLLCLIRGHWTIENRSHYVRDVTFGEDVCRVRSGGAGQVLAALRNACISLIRLSGHSNVAAARRFYAAKPCAALKSIGIQITE